MVLSIPLIRTGEDELKKRAAQEDGRTYESHQEPGYFSANSSISQGFEPVWDNRNDQSVDDEVGE